MEKQQERFLAVMKAALDGQPVQGMDDLAEADWRALAKLASLHKVLPLVSHAVYHLPGAQTVFAGLKPGIRRQVMIQAQKTYAFLELNRRLRAACVRALVVKGIICRSVYPNGDLRLSADEDVLVAPGQLPQARSVMEAMGLTTTESAEDAHEYPYRAQTSPLYIELHAHLFAPGTAAYGGWNGYFENAFDRAVEVEIQGEKVLTMAPTDHLLYLMLHAFKHFLHSGVGIRQVCDIVQFSNAWGGQVDWDYLVKCCREVRAEGFTQAIFTIGEKYLGLDREKVGVPASWVSGLVDETALLEDMLAGGVYGGSSRSRQHSSNMTLDAVAAVNRGQKSRTGVISSLFPKTEKLVGRYPYLKEKPYLLPMAWADRILHYAGELKDAPDSAAEAVSIGNRRLALLRQYDVID